jgi:hypothetical protein
MGRWIAALQIQLGKRIPIASLIMRVGDWADARALEPVFIQENSARQNDLPNPEVVKEKFFS